MQCCTVLGALSIITFLYLGHKWSRCSAVLVGALSIIMLLNLGPKLMEQEMPSVLSDNVKEEGERGDLRYNSEISNHLEHMALMLVFH